LHLKEKANMSGIVQIPKPCHESWQAMQPQANGRFCDSCCKVVVDFTNFSNQEIVEYLQAKNKERICGRFKVEQVKQTSMPEIIQLKDRNKIWKLQQFAAALLLAFGSILFTSCNTELPRKEVLPEKKKLLGMMIVPLNTDNQHEIESKNDTVKKKKTKATCESQTTELLGDVVVPETLVGKIAYPQPVVDSVSQNEEIIKGEVQQIEPN
jgi:hypothetical protein